MILTTEQQYRLAKEEVGRFEAALAALAAGPADRPPEARELMRAAFESQLAELRAQLAAYEAVRAGAPVKLTTGSLENLGDVLVCARLTAGLSQDELAALLELPAEQVRRDEATRYAEAGLERLRGVAALLGVGLELRAELPARGTLAPPPSRAELLGRLEPGVPTGAPAGDRRRARTPAAGQA